MLAGELHYFRLPKKAWTPCLRAMHKLGFTAVDAPVPWCLHGQIEGQFDQKGSLDLSAFIAAARAEDLEVILRPGPHLGRELPGLGFPEHVTSNSAVLDQTAQGTTALWPFPPLMTPLPSYASTVFQEKVRGWFASLAEALGDATAELACVVADHELGFFHRDGAYDLGYHPDALALWSEFSGGDEAPKSWQPQRADSCARWVLFHDELRAGAARWLDSALADAGFSCPRFASAQTPSTRAAAPLSRPALTSYATREQMPALKHRLTRAGAGAAAGPVTVIAGGSPFLIPRAPLDDLSNLAAAVSSGARSLSVAMAVERDRWYGAWITADGRTTDHGHAMGRVLRALVASGWPKLAAKPAIAVVATRADARMAAASSAVGNLPSSIARAARFAAEDFAADAEARDKNRWYDALARALRLSQIPYRTVEEAFAEPDAVQAIIAPTLGPLDDELRARLQAFTQAGAKVVIGPERPAKLPGPCGLLRKESLTDISALADDLQGLCDELGDDFITPEQPAFECTPLFDDSGRARLVAVANATDEAADAEMTVPEGASFRDPFSERSLVADAEGFARLSLSPRQVRLFVSDE